MVDTALFKAYLVVRPGLVGALCRRYKWCEVSEVEEELRAREVSLFLSLFNERRKLVTDWMGRLAEIPGADRSVSWEEDA